jgi:transposase
MPKSRPSYPAEFRARMVELSREFEPSAQSVRIWVAQADQDQGLRNDGLKTDEREELSRLRREVRTLKQEREILAKAAAWFAQETEQKSSRS